MKKTITLTINGQQQTLEVKPEMKLIDLIREQLNLTGTKRGCDNGTCGSCVVILNGKAVKSCTTAVEKADGGHLVTVEGLSDGLKLHLVQDSLIQSGAIQCGFCTPGIITELVALFDQNSKADKEEIVNALNKHLCRCTGYEPIIEGALKARQRILSEVEE